MKWLLSLGMLCFICMVMSAVVGVSTSSVFQIPVCQPHEGNRIKAAKEGRLAEYERNYHAHLLRRLTDTGEANAAGANTSFDNTNYSRSSGVAASMTDYYDLLYTGTISIGTGRLGRKQKFVVQFDTGSRLFWIPDVTCGTGDSHLTKEQCQRKRRFNSSLSTTYKQDGTEFSTEYGTEIAKGFQGIDTVRIGAAGGAQLVIPDTTFGQAIDMSEIYIDSPFDGVLGLGLPSKKSNFTPPLVNAFNQGLVAEPIFTAYLYTGANETYVDAPNGGVFTFGGLDTTHCGDIVDWVQLDMNSRWIFKVNAVKVGSKTVTSWSATALSDTGTSWILGPATFVRAIARQVGAKRSRKYGTYVVKCDATYAPVTFVINNKHYNLTSKVLTIRNHLPDNWCQFGIQPAAMGGRVAVWIFGDPFIRAYCNTYDVLNKRIGLSPTLGVTHDNDYYDDNVSAEED